MYNKEEEKRMRHFDTVIANPPYANGNAIVKNLLDSGIADEYIILMPFSKYKAGNLYKHVISLSLVDPEAFKDATITDNLCVCRLIEEEIQREFVDLEIETFNQDYREFYELNRKLKVPYKDDYSIPFCRYNGSEEGRKEAIDTVLRQLKSIFDDHGKRVFIYTARAVLDGTHAADGDAHDIKWNLKHEFFDAKAPIGDMGTRSKPAIGLSIFLEEFKSEKECANFTRFFYANGKDGLMNKLVKGMNKTCGTLKQAIPNIDWSIDRDYEHLTYEQLLEIMKSEIAK